VAITLLVQILGSQERDRRESGPRGDVAASRSGLLDWRASQAECFCPIPEIAMIRMFVRHTVADFATWNEAYRDFDEERRGMGVIGDAVFTSADDPNDVTVWHDFESLTSARAFAESERLREVMSNAGVASEPAIWFASPV
jgi:hypothetical protein